MKDQDKLVRFLFENSAIRGEIIHLDECYREILKRHDYTLSVQQYIGQALVSASLLSATLKYEGSLILQIQGNGPLSLLVAQANMKHEVRGLAKWEGEVSSEFEKAVGKGHLAITINTGTTGERYQGVVDLRGNNLARVIENYFYQSEQIPTYLFLAANEKSAGGFLLQLLPDADDEAKDYWQHLGYLARTLTLEELLNLEVETVLHRLFHQEKLKVLASHDIKFVCRCSRDAMAKAILTLGLEDARKLLEEKQVISVACEFCYQELTFDRIDVERIFLNSSSHDDRVLM
jgi:molecular chaperone Hsp33